jgi:hypothetical protein
VHPDLLLESGLSLAMIVIEGNESTDAPLGLDPAQGIGKAVDEKTDHGLFHTVILFPSAMALDQHIHCSGPAIHRAGRAKCQHITASLQPDIQFTFEHRLLLQ